MLAWSRLLRHAAAMIFGSHIVVFSSDADADRAFFADTLGFDHVDAGGGWLIFDLPPAELAIHPADTAGAELYFMCDDLASEMQRLTETGIHCSEIEEARWGSVTKFQLPGGGAIGIYQPKHAIVRKGVDD